MTLRSVIGIGMLAGLVTLAGCAPMPRMTLGTSGPPKVRAVPHPSSEPRITGNNRAEIRTTLNGLPATGATCRILAQDLSIEFHTPATVALPVLYGPVAPATLTCKFGEHRASRTLHASRKMELRDDLPDRPFGLVIGAAAAVTAGTLDMWSYVSNGSVLTLEMADQRSGGIE